MYVSKNCYDMFNNLTNIRIGGEKFNLSSLCNVISDNFTNISDYFVFNFLVGEIRSKEKKCYAFKVNSFSAPVFLFNEIFMIFFYSLKINTWSGSIEIGVITCDPSTIDPSTTATMIVDGAWVSILSQKINNFSYITR